MAARISILLWFLMLLFGENAMGQGLQQRYKDPSAPIDERVRDLLSRMTLEEKAGQWVNAAPAVERLDIPAYDWWSEGLRGAGGICNGLPTGHWSGCDVGHSSPGGRRGSHQR